MPMAMGTAIATSSFVMDPWVRSFTPVSLNPQKACADRDCGSNWAFRRVGSGSRLGSLKEFQQHPIYHLRLLLRHRVPTSVHQMHPHQPSTRPMLHSLERPRRLIHAPLLGARDVTRRHIDRASRKDV